MTKTQQLLIEYVSQEIIDYIIKERNISMVEAMKEFYNSETFDRLSDVETGLYLESPDYTYPLYKREQSEGHFYINIKPSDSHIAENSLDEKANNINLTGIKF